MAKTGQRGRPAGQGARGAGAAIDPEQPVGDGTGPPGSGRAHSAHGGNPGGGGGSRHRPARQGVIATSAAIDLEQLFRSFA